MYDQVVQSQRAGLCLSEHFLIIFAVFNVSFRRYNVVDKVQFFTFITL